LSRIVGAQIAKRMIMCGETIDAARAQSLGIVSEVVPKGDAVASAMALAQTMLANGPLAIRLAKRVIDEGLEASLYTALNFEMDSTALLFVTDDKREGIEAFNEKRTPVFAGK
jgi:enoyl-CoA hydratase/carnithine racemase